MKRAAGDTAYPAVSSAFLTPVVAPPSAPDGERGSCRFHALQHAPREPRRFQW